MASRVHLLLTSMVAFASDESNDIDDVARLFFEIRSAGQTTPVNNDRAGPSDLNSFSESLKSRLQAVSTRYS
jgi:hypothetical protein